MKITEFELVVLQHRDMHASSRVQDWPQKVVTESEVDMILS